MDQGEEKKLSKSARRRRNRRRRKQELLNSGAQVEQVDAQVADNSGAKVDIQSAAKLVISDALRDRDMDCWNWIVHGSGLTDFQIISQVMRNFVVAKKSDFREASGGGGSSSQNIEQLTERLPVHKVTGNG